MSHSLSDTCTVHNEKLEDDFTVFPNEIWEHEYLSGYAKFLLGYILSRPKNWSVRVSHLASIYKGEFRGNGIDATRSAINELKEFGYIVYRKSKNEKGHWNHSYHTYPFPYERFKIMFPHRVKPDVAEPGVVKPNIITRTERTNTEYNKKQQQDKPVVVFYDCLPKELSHEEKSALMKFPEDRVKLAVEFSKITPPKEELIRQLVWHCNQKKPPIASKSMELKKACAEFFSKNISKTYEISIGDETITFIPLSGQGRETTIKFSEKDSHLKIKDMVDKGKFKCIKS